MPASWIIGLGGWIGVAVSLSLLNHRVFEGSSKLSRFILLLGPFLGGALGYLSIFLLSLQYQIFASMVLPEVLLPICIVVPCISFVTGPLFFVTAILEFATPRGVPEPQETPSVLPVAPSTLPTVPVVILGEASQSLLPPSDGTGGTEDTTVPEVPAIAAIPAIPSSETIVSTPQETESSTGNTSEELEDEYADMPALEEIEHVDISAVYEPIFRVEESSDGIATRNGC
jgi:hypothetical protein